MNTYHSALKPGGATHLHEGEGYLLSCALIFIKRLLCFCFHTLQHWFLSWTRPSKASLLLGTVADLVRGKSELVAENALLRHQLIILRRQITRPMCTKKDRILLVLLARTVRTWRQALLIVQPETLLRWHRQGFRLFWRDKSRAISAKPKVAAETIALIKEMAKNNRLWGAERIRGELLKLGIRVCKRTIQKYMKQARVLHPRGQTWSTFLRNHAEAIWACDFLQVTDLFFRSLFIFFIIELKSRKVIHVGVTQSPTDTWVAQRLRQATPYGQGPRYLIRDNDSKFGPCFARVAGGSAIKVLRTPVHAPRANAICERFLGSVRRECLDHLLLLNERQHEPSPQILCRLLSSCKAASGLRATDPRARSRSWSITHQGWQSDRFFSLGWATPYLPKSCVAVCAYA